MKDVIDELNKAKREIESQIEFEKKRRITRKRGRKSGEYARIVCRDCNGNGSEMDHRSPTRLGDCCTCNGKGYLWRRVWEGLRHHKTEFEGKEDLND